IELVRSPVVLHENTLVMTKAGQCSLCERLLEIRVRVDLAKCLLQNGIHEPCDMRIQLVPAELGRNPVESKCEPHPRKSIDDLVIQKPSILAIQTIPP